MKEFLAIFVLLIGGLVAVSAKQPTIPYYDETTRTLTIPVVQLKDHRTGAILQLKDNGTYAVELVPLYCGFSPNNILCDVQ